MAGQAWDWIVQAGATVAREIHARPAGAVRRYSVGRAEFSMTKMKIYTGSDHAGFDLRGRVVAHLRALGFEVEDLGTPSAESTDYPDWAAAVGRAVRDHRGTVGVLVCGTGLGVCMAANKIHGIRAADAWSVEAARLSRAHNDANVLCVGARLVPEATTFAVIDAWLDTEFEGGRHARRVDKIMALEGEEAEAARQQTKQEDRPR